MKIAQLTHTVVPAPRREPNPRSAATDHAATEITRPSSSLAMKIAQLTHTVVPAPRREPIPGRCHRPCCNGESRAHLRPLAMKMNRTHPHRRSRAAPAPEQSGAGIQRAGASFDCVVSSHRPGSAHELRKGLLAGEGGACPEPAEGMRGCRRQRLPAMASSILTGTGAITTCHSG